MRNFNENTITDAVLERIARATDPRIKQSAKRWSVIFMPSSARCGRPRRNGNTASTS